MNQKLFINHDKFAHKSLIVTYGMSITKFQYQKAM